MDDQPFMTPEGVRVQLVGSKLRLGVPRGMSMAEAVTIVQPYIDRANQATGEDIQMTLPDEDVKIDTEELIPIPWLTRLFVWLRWLPREEKENP